MQPQPALDRNHYAWFAFWAVMGLHIFFGLILYFNPPTPKLEALEKHLISKRSDAAYLTKASAEIYLDQLDRLRSGDSERKAALRIIVQYSETRSKASAKELVAAGKSPLGINASTFAAIYGENPMGPQDWKELERAGKWRPILETDRKRLPLPPKQESNVPWTRIGVFMILAGATLWSKQYAAGLSKPRWVAQEVWKPTTPEQQRSVIWRVIGLFFLPPLIGSMFPSAAADIIAMLVIVFAVLLVPLGKERLSLGSMVGKVRLSTPFAAWGSYLGALPLVPLGLLIMALLNFFLPEGTHSLSESLLTSNEGIGIAVVEGVIVAPILEEFLFRGLIFPLMLSRFGSVWKAGLFSSFLFAAVHMQGPPAWPILMLLAGACTYAYVHTKSLVASMIVHATHNALILLLVLNMSL